MAKRPFLKLFPSDLRGDPKLRACCRAARSFWVDVFGLMNDESDQYGFLLIDGKMPTPKKLARMLGDTEDEVRAWMAELLEAGVPSVTPEGVWYSRRMKREAEKAAADAANGAKGGNPALLGGAEQLDLFGREADRRAKASDRQRRRREKKKAALCASGEQPAAEGPDVTLQSVTVTRDKRDASRDAKRDVPPISATKTTRVTGLTPRVHIPESRSSPPSKVSAAPIGAPPSRLNGGGAPVAPPKAADSPAKPKAVSRGRAGLSAEAKQALAERGVLAVVPEAPPPEDPRIAEQIAALRELAAVEAREKPPPQTRTVVAA